MNTNQTPPELMSPQERLDEVAAILALSFSRVHQRQSRPVRTRTSTQIPLDSARQQSVHGLEPEKGESAWNLE